MALERLWTEHADVLRQHLGSADAAPIALVSAAGVVLEANASFDRLTGAPRGAAGRKLPELADGAAAPAPGGATVAVRLGTRTEQFVAFHVYPCAAGKVVVGEKVVFTETHIMEKIADMHGQLVNTTRELHKKNRALEEARAEIRTLGGILPICVRCKKIRNDQGYWEQVEAYVSRQTDASFTHGLCDDCLPELYPRDEFPSLYEDRKE